MSERLKEIDTQRMKQTYNTSYVKDGDEGKEKRTE